MRGLLWASPSRAVRLRPGWREGAACDAHALVCVCVLQVRVHDDLQRAAGVHQLVARLLPLARIHLLLQVRTPPPPPPLSLSLGGDRQRLTGGLAGGRYSYELMLESQFTGLVFDNCTGGDPCTGEEVPPAPRTRGRVVLCACVCAPGVVRGCRSRPAVMEAACGCGGGLDAEPPPPPPHSPAVCWPSEAAGAGSLRRHRWRLDMHPVTCKCSHVTSPCHVT